MAKKRKSKVSAPKINLSSVVRGRRYVVKYKKELKNEMRASIPTTKIVKTNKGNVQLKSLTEKETYNEQGKKLIKILEARRNLEISRNIQRKAISQAARQVRQRIEAWANQPVVNKKILRKGPRPTLDLRRRPEREVPVKQHGFKEGEVSYTNILSQ